MNKIKSFFKNTVKNGVTLVKKNPMASIGGTVVAIVLGSSVISSNNLDKTSSSDNTLDTQTSYTQTTDDTTSTYTTTSTTTTSPATTSVTTGTKTSETGTTTVAADKTEFLSDYLKQYVEKVTFENNNKPYIIDDEQLLEQSGYVLNEDGTITNTDGYTVDFNGDYITEDVVIDGNYYEKDGIVYTSKEAYDKLNSETDKFVVENHEGEVLDFELIDDRAEYTYIQDDLVIDGTYFIDEDGIVWTSKEAYDEFINPEYNQKGYTAPDGSEWSSEQAYLDSLKEYEEVDTTNETTKPAETTETTVTEEKTPDTTDTTSVEPVNPEVTETTTETTENQQIETEDEYFEAPDGSKWTSKEAYDAYLEEYEKALSEEEVEKQETTTEVVTEPVSETTTTTATETTTEQVGGNDEPQAPIFTEEQPVETEDEYFKAPDGSYWTSKEAYEENEKAYQEMLRLEEEAAKQETTTEAVTEAVSETTTTTTTTEVKEESTKKPETSTTAEPKEEKKEENKEEKKADYYTAPDGSIWTSEADYLEFIQEFEVESEKTR